MTPAPNATAPRERENFLKFEACPKDGSQVAIFVGSNFHETWTTFDGDEKTNGVELFFAIEQNDEFYFVKTNIGANSTDDRSKTYNTYLAATGNPLTPAESIQDAVGKPVILNLKTEDKVSKKGNEYSITKLVGNPMQIMSGMPTPDSLAAQAAFESEVARQESGDEGELEGSPF
jgi:hypothetical protein